MNKFLLTFSVVFILFLTGLVGCDLGSVVYQLKNPFQSSGGGDTTDDSEEGTTDGTTLASISTPQGEDIVSSLIQMMFYGYLAATEEDEAGLQVRTKHEVEDDAGTVVGCLSACGHAYTFSGTYEISAATTSISTDFLSFDDTDACDIGTIAIDTSARALDIDDPSSDGSCTGYTSEEDAGGGQLSCEGFSNFSGDLDYGADNEEENSNTVRANGDFVIEGITCALQANLTFTSPESGDDEMEQDDYLILAPLDNNSGPNAQVAGYYAEFGSFLLVDPISGTRIAAGETETGAFDEFGGNGDDLSCDTASVIADDSSRATLFCAYHCSLNSDPGNYFNMAYGTGTCSFSDP